MPRSLKLYIAGLVAVSTLMLIATSFRVPIDVGIAARWTNFEDPTTLEVFAGLAYWTLITLAASLFPVKMPRGMIVFVSSAPIYAAMALGGPTAGAWVALLGTFDGRELRGRIPWYGSLANHAGIVPPVIVGGLVMNVLGRDSGFHLQSFVAVIAGATAMFVMNILIVSVLLSLRTGMPVRNLIYADTRTFASSHLALAPLGWLMARLFLAEGWWATLVFALPLYTTRRVYAQLVVMRDMFTQTIEVLAEAVDKRDPFTSLHSKRVMMIARDIGREMRLGEVDLEALEWGGLLHDVGKIGVPDAVLLKAERLTKEERMQMNSHPVLGAQIIAPVTRLSRELPIIRNHHEWYNGSGYPDRLIGDEIPLLARILHVADAFEAMTAQRPYRMVPLTREQALGELRKFAGIQFDPRIVDAFVKTSWVDGVPDPGRPSPPRPIPLISQHAAQMAAQSPAPTQLQTATATAQAAHSATHVATPKSPTA
jgi:putative nucleotidyltransferase with HDIG domain